MSASRDKLLSKIFYSLCYIYVALPILIFMLGWCRKLVAWPATVIIIACLVSMIRHMPEHEWHIPANLKTLETFIFVGIMVFLVVFLSGIGGASYQNSDHSTRNGIYQALVNNAWPIRSQVPLDDGTSIAKGLIYYIGFWMPAALWGKIFGIYAGYVFQIFWAWLGIMLVYFLISDYVKRVTYWPAIVFLGFSGLDIIGMLLMGDSFKEFFIQSWRVEYWNLTYQFSSHITMLYWVFNQAVPAWIMVMLILRQTKNRYIVAIMGMTLLCGPFPFIGMLPFAVYLMLSRRYKADCFRSKKAAGDLAENSDSVSTVHIFQKGWLKPWLKDTFSWENILAGGITGIVTGIYLMGNIVSQVTTADNGSVTQSLTAGTGIFDQLRLALLSTNAYYTASTVPMYVQKKVDIFIYIVFILFDVFFNFVIAYRYNKKNPLLYIALGWLMVCPLIKVGAGIDFCMRASIPALLVLCVLTINGIKCCLEKHDKFWLTFMVIVLCIGAVTPVHEVYMTMKHTMLFYQNRMDYAEACGELNDYLKQPNFAGNLDGNFFFTYIAK